MQQQVAEGQQAYDVQQMMSRGEQQFTSSGGQQRVLGQKRNFTQMVYQNGNDTMAQPGLTYDGANGQQQNNMTCMGLDGYVKVMKNESYDKISQMRLKQQFQATRFNLIDRVCEKQA